MKKRVSLVWFKTDLRIRDNETLAKAIDLNDEVVPVYCLDARLIEGTYLGFSRMGKFRLKFLWESIQDLDKNLRKLHSGLVLVYGHPEVEIPRLASLYNAHAVFAKKEVSIEEQQTDLLVEKALWKQQCTLESYSTSTLYRADDLPFSIKDIPDTFTAFRKAVESEARVRTLIQNPKEIKSPEIPELELPEFVKNIQQLNCDNRSTFLFHGGESEFWKRLEYYFFESRLLCQYRETRNGLIGSDYSSKFSSWLSLGCVSPKSIYYEVKRFEKSFGENDSTYWLIFELMWRDYFRFMFKKHHQKYFLRNGIKKIKKAIVNHHQPALVSKWIAGETGNDFVDANMRELLYTGFMSNRGRQNVASFFCHDLKQDWRYGAAYFESMLVDYDPCSNWGNWAYIAGVGNDPVANRKFNLENQANEYDPKSEYRKLWLC
jgi:deoxyribodipyrimidine photo-lyase